MKVKKEQIEDYFSDYYEDNIPLPDIDKEWEKFEKKYFHENNHTDSISKWLSKTSLIIVSTVLLLFITLYFISFQTKHNTQFSFNDKDLLRSIMRNDKIITSSDTNISDTINKQIVCRKNGISRIVNFEHNSNHFSSDSRFLQLKEILSLPINKDFKNLSFIKNVGRFNKLKVSGLSTVRRYNISMGIEYSQQILQRKQYSVDFYVYYSRPILNSAIFMSMGIGFGQVNNINTEVHKVRILTDNSNGVLIKDSSIRKDKLITYLIFPLRFNKKIFKNWSINAGGRLIVPFKSMSENSNYRNETSILRPNFIDSGVQFSNEVIKNSNKSVFKGGELSLSYTLGKLSVNFGMKLILKSKSKISLISESFPKSNLKYYIFSLEYRF